MLSFCPIGANVGLHCLLIFCEVLQGRKDPMQNAPRRANQMDKLCSNVQVVLVDAGHCPFDESPDFCNRELLSFMDSLKRISPAPVSTNAESALSTP